MKILFFAHFQCLSRIENAILSINLSSTELKLKVGLHNFSRIFKLYYEVLCLKLGLKILKGEGT